MNILDFQKKKNKNEKITFVTCYDYTSARIADASDVDCILVGDSLAMTMHGYSTTVPATMEMMVMHTSAVVKGAPNTFVVGDLPFLSYRKGLTENMDAVQALMQAGAQAVKLEGLDGNQQLIKHIVKSGVPVMGHIGLTPQSVHALGGFRVQGREEAVAKDLLEQAKLLEQSGCFSIVLECMPAKVAQHITDAIHIPTIGIGAGPHTSGQILVWQDMLGMQDQLSIKFVKRYFNGFEMIKNSLNAYHQEVQAAVYPDIK
ncbi:MAG: 3-methyl-2-oxobutanoate hydroxymethyltransferase, partial [Coxiellaceae bacterium]|nr:3-methyl-2-oxobutanoate hydroxymethyltransferase [Coxiellaceae bacterium]